MRILGYFSLDAVSYAIYEANGTLSALENENIETSSDLPLLIVKGGKTDKKNLEKIGYTEDKLNKFLLKQGIKKIKNVGVFTVDGGGRFYLQQFNKKYQTGNLKINKENI